MTTTLRYRSSHWEPLRGYITALAAVMIALALKFIMQPMIKMESPFLIFFSAVVISAWYGGFGPGIFAAFFSALLADLFFIEPKGQLTVLKDAQYALRVIIFLIEGVLVSSLSLALQRSQKREHLEALYRQQVQQQLQESDRKFAQFREDQLRQMNTELEARVAERTRQLEEANVQLEGFTRTVSHDLRAPLRAIEGFSQILLQDYSSRLEEEGQDYLRRIVRAAQNMSQLLTDLLAYSRFGSEKLDLQPVPLEQAVALAMTALETDIQFKQAQVEIRKPLGQVVASPAALTHILTNLLDNALLYKAPETPPHIQIASEERGDAIRLCIQDNGIGIAPEHQERVFKMFERLHGMETYPGSGVGLALVSKGIERMNGRYGVESTPGQGSTFWIELPKAGHNGHAA